MNKNFLKSFLIVFLGLCFSQTSVILSTRADDIDSYGDINRDGCTNICDVLLLKSTLVDENMQNMDNKSPDVNRDGKVTVSDFYEMQMYFFGNMPIWSQELYIDADGDNLCDYYESNIYGTNPNKSDTDSDGVSDYDEIFLTYTDPLNSDSNKNGISDLNDDNDNDKLSNKQELQYGTNPTESDTDNDGISDYEEIFTYETNPLIDDTDNDLLTDYFEIFVSGTNPLTEFTDGKTSDKFKKTNQTINTDDEILKGINTNNNEYQLYIELNSSLNPNDSIDINISKYSEYAKHDKIYEFIQGHIIDVNYNYKDVVSEAVFYFNLEDRDISDYSIFKYNETINMFMPIETYYDNTKNVIYTKGNSNSTYCVVNTDMWYNEFIKQSATYITIDNVKATDETTSVLFMLDLRFLTNKCNITTEIVQIAKSLFKEYGSDLTLDICFFSNVDGDISISEFTGLKCVEDVQLKLDILEMYYGMYSNLNQSYMLSLMETPLYMASNVYDNGNYNHNYVFTFAANKYGKNSYPNSLFSSLKNINDFHACYILNSAENNATESYVQNYIDNYNGKIFYTSEKLDEEIVAFMHSGNNSDNKRFSYPDFVNLNYDKKISSNWKTAVDSDTCKTLQIPDSDGDGLYDCFELNMDYIKFDDNGNPVFPTLESIANVDEETKKGFKWFIQKLTDEGFDPFAFKESEVIILNSYPEIIDSDSDGRNDARDACPDRGFDNRFEIKDNYNEEPVNLIPDNCTAQFKTSYGKYNTEDNVVYIAGGAAAHKVGYAIVAGARSLGMKIAPEMLFTFLGNHKGGILYPIDDLSNIIANTRAQRYSFYHNMNLFMRCVEDIVVPNDTLTLSSRKDKGLIGVNFSNSEYGNAMMKMITLECDCFLGISNGENMIVSNVKCDDSTGKKIYDADIKFYLFDSYDWENEKPMCYVQSSGYGCPFYSYGMYEFHISWIENSAFPTTYDGQEIRDPFEIDLSIVDFSTYGISDFSLKPFYKLLGLVDEDIFDIWF